MTDLIQFSTENDLGPLREPLFLHIIRDFFLTVLSRIVKAVCKEDQGFSRSSNDGWCQSCWRSRLSEGRVVRGEQGNATRPVIRHSLSGDTILHADTQPHANGSIYTPKCTSVRRYILTLETK